MRFHIERIDQNDLAGISEVELLRLGYHILMCTVHPDNRFSRSNMLKQGYRGERLKSMEDTGGKFL